MDNLDKMSGKFEVTLPDYLPHISDYKGDMTKFMNGKSEQIKESKDMLVQMALIARQMEIPKENMTKEKVIDFIQQ
jgi:hypothetical protein